MDVVNLSQKQKVSLFILLLCTGFSVLAIFTARSLNGMSGQYRLSSDIASGALMIQTTRARLLSLALTRNEMTSAGTGTARAAISELMKDVSRDVSFLNANGFNNEVGQLEQAAGKFEQALSPWLTIKSELGFTLEEGKLGELKQLAKTIEDKINETGMVTLNSDFQAMIKAQQTYLLQPSDQNQKLFNRAMAGFVSMSNSYAMLDIYRKEVDQFKSVFARVSELSRQSKEHQIQLAEGEEQVQSLIEGIAQKLQQLSIQHQKQADDSATATLWSVLVACAILAIVTLALFTMQNLSVGRALRQIKAVLESLSRGDLSQRLALTGNKRDEFNQLAEVINQSCENLGKLVQGVQNSSQALSGDAVTLNSRIDTLVGRQSEVMSQTTILASATEEVSATTSEVSGSLEFVASVSQSSTQAAENGARVISAAIGSLEEIGDILTSAAGHIQQLEAASAKVDSVMDIINSIAEQTNLLALNAAIEAARAGDQGRGFAVVADEVRSLAVRTVDAVSDISATIEAMKKESSEVIQYINRSERSMKAGQQWGHEAMEALSQITGKADEAAHQTEVIFASMKELATTCQSMADSMSQISLTMQQLEESNGQLRSTSEVVEQRSALLEAECRRFTV